VVDCGDDGAEAVEGEVVDPLTPSVVLHIAQSGSDMHEEAADNRGSEWRGDEPQHVGKVHPAIVQVTYDMAYGL
jgi:hypothetical protein